MGWRSAVTRAVGAAEPGEADEADRVCSLRNIATAIAQQAMCYLQAYLADEIAWRIAGDDYELAMQTCARHVQGACQSRHR